MGTKLMNGRPVNELPVNGMSENKLTEQKEISEGSDGSEQETAEYMNGMESTDVNIDDDDEEDDDEQENLENHFSMQPDDDFDDNEEEEKQKLNELQQTNFFQARQLREYKNKMNEYKESNANINTLYFELLATKNNDDALNKKELIFFKKSILSSLHSLRSEYVKQVGVQQNKIRNERKKMMVARDKMLKQKENENKALRAKNNESRTEYTQIKQSVDKIKRENALEKEQIVKRMEKLEEDKEALTKNLEKQRELVEIERKEKMAVSDKNAEYLRNEKIKISKQLDKERKDRHRLEQKVSLLEDECSDEQRKMEQYEQQNKKLAATEKSHQNMAEKAMREREESMTALLAKTKYFKAQQTQFDETQIEIELLRKQSENQRSEIKQLHEAIRK